MNAILGFKNFEEEKENLLCRDDLRDRLNAIHEKLMSQVSLVALQEPSSEVSFPFLPTGFPNKGEYCV